MCVKIAIVGGGIIGLSTAQALLEDYTQIEVTVYSDYYTPNTTADSSAGFIYPFLISQIPNEDLRKWTLCTIDYLAQIHKSGDAVSTGISPTSAYFVWKHSPKSRKILEMFDGFREMKMDELRRLTDVQYAGGYFVTSWSCDCKIYLPYIMNILSKQGVKFITEKITSLEDLGSRGYDIIINCTGFGASKLTTDSSLRPLQGQVLIAKAPWIKHAFFEDDGDVYLIPCMGEVFVGGSHDQVDSLTPSKQLLEHIKIEATKVFPSLKHAEILRAQVGIRPGRTNVRMEFEYKQTLDGRKYVILHHYGHGGAGVTLHRGCAKQVSALLRDSISFKANL